MNDVAAANIRQLSRKTRIIATIGPATRTPEVIREILLAGVNVIRMNFSHGTHEGHKEVLDDVRKVAASLNNPVAILQDLSGPKIRITAVDGDYQMIPDGGSIEVTRSKEKELSTADRLYVEGLDPLSFVKAHQRILLADGIIELESREIQGEVIKCHITKGGRIRSRVGIAFPDSDIDLPATTEKDMRDLEWGIENGVDYVALSFVQNASDVERVRAAIRARSADIRIISKIERKKALDNIDEILEASDGLMVARGDLGLEIPVEQLPTVQKQLIELGNNRGAPVIVATQMLHSMVSSVRPTRAEVSDIAAAVMSGADAVMLSEETAIGENPVLAVEYLGKIAKEAEKTFTFETYRLRLGKADRATIPDAVAYAAAAAANKLGASAVVSCTETGNSARLLAKYRPQQALFGVSSSEKALRRMSLYWGVTPIPVTGSESHRDELEIALKEVQLRGEFENGSLAVITGGLAVRTPGATSVLEIMRMQFR
jgi:pyruvate kinase